MSRTFNFPKLGNLIRPAEERRSMVAAQFEKSHATAQGRKEIHPLKMWRRVVARN